jgi:hypothetical protein
MTPAHRYIAGINRWQRLAADWPAQGTLPLRVAFFALFLMYPAVSMATGSTLYRVRVVSSQGGVWTTTYVTSSSGTVINFDTGTTFDITVYRNSNGTSPFDFKLTPPGGSEMKQTFTSATSALWAGQSGAGLWKAQIDLTTAFTFTMQQSASCSYSVSPTSWAPIVAGESKTFGVTTTSGCAWTASESASWLSLSPSGGTGSGNVTATADGNPTGASRSSTMTIAGKSVPVTQGYCTVTYSPTSRSVGAGATTGSIAVTATSGCPWTATSDSPAWLTITSGASGSGSGTINYSVAANAGGARTGTISGSGATFTVSQDGFVCSYSVSPTSWSPIVAGESKTFGVTTTSGCAWTASESASWLSLSPSGGTGSGNVTATADANPTGASRSSTMTIAGTAVPVTQGYCTVTYSPTSRSVGSGATTGSIAVTATSGCPWTATSDSPAWLTITSGASGSGSGTINYSALANTGTTRSGTISGTGATFSLSQAGPAVPAITSFLVNNGASSTTTRVVTLNSTATNGPTEYLASEDAAFGDASWQGYSAAAQFNIVTAGDGTKTVYFKLRNGVGESTVATDTITLSEQNAATKLSGFANIKAVVDSQVKLQAKLEHDAWYLGWPDIEGRTVRFEIFDESLSLWSPISDDDISTTSRTTDANGVGSQFLYVRNLVANHTYLIRAVFDGDAQYAASSVQAQMHVVMAGQQITSVAYRINSAQVPWILKDSQGNLVTERAATHADAKIPLILVHGGNSELDEDDTLRADARWSTFWQYINAHQGQYSGFEVYTWIHDTSKAIGFNGITGNAAELADCVNNYILPHHVPGTKVMFVAHSRGGLVVRSFMNSGVNANDVLGVVTLGTPHRGSPLAVPDWTAIHWAGTLGANDLWVWAFNQLVGPGRMFNTERLGELVLAWDNVDGSVGNGQYATSFAASFAAGGSVVLTPRDTNRAQSYTDSTVMYSGTHKSVFGTLEALNASFTPANYKKVIAFGAYDPSNGFAFNFATKLLDAGGCVLSLIAPWFDHNCLKTLTPLLGGMSSELNGTAGPVFYANDGMVPVQSALALDTSGGENFASISSDGSIVSVDSTTIRNHASALRGYYLLEGADAIDQDGRVHMLNGTDVRDHLHLLDAGDAYWALVTDAISTLLTPAPDAFGKWSPANGTANQPLNVALEWDISSGATRYEYCVNTSETCSGEWTSTGMTQTASLSGLARGTTYYWQVRAVNGSGATDADGGAWWRFTTQAPTRVIGLSGNLAFGNVTVNTTATATLTISNTGNSALAVSSITYPPGFSGNWASGTVAAGGSQPVTVTFAPTAVQAYSGTVTVNSDKTSGTNTMAASGTGTARARAGDFTGDLKSDILWRHATLGDVWLWRMDGAARTAETYVRTVGDTNWEIRGIGDYDGDGKADILWRNKTTGMIYLWLMNGSALLAETYVSTVSPSYDIVGTGDFNGDGKSDILWRHLTNGEVWVWLMNGATRLSSPTWVGTVPDLGYQVAGVADFTGDLKSDILWRHATSGAVWLWPMDGAARTAETYVRTVADTNWEIRGVGDQTGDGKADVLWRHKTTGMIYLWPMNGSALLSETYVGAVDVAYDIAGTGDFNGDGKSDILWRHLTNGEVWVWLMDGTVPLSRTWVGTVSDVGYRPVAVK